MPSTNYPFHWLSAPSPPLYFQGDFFYIPIRAISTVTESSLAFYLFDRNTGEKVREKNGKKRYEKKAGNKFRKKSTGKKCTGKKVRDKIEGKSQVTSGDVTSGQACARYHFRVLLIAPPQILSENVYILLLFDSVRVESILLLMIYFIMHKLKISIANDCNSDFMLPVFVILTMF